MIRTIGPLALLAAAIGLAEGLARGGSLRAAAHAGVLLGALAGLALAALAGLAWALGGLLPPGRRAGPWPLAAALSLLGLTAGVTAIAGVLTARHRDPDLIALTVAVLALPLAWLCVAAAPPLVARGQALAGRWLLPWLARARPIRRAGLLVLALGALALLDLAFRPQRLVLPSELAARALKTLQSASDFDGDGAGVVFPPRDRAPLDPKVAAKAAARR